MLRLMEVAIQSARFAKLRLRKAKAKTSIEVNCLIATPRAIRSKFFPLTGRLYWLFGVTLEEEFSTSVHAPSITEHHIVRQRFKIEPLTCA